MNRERRKNLQSIADQLEELKSSLEDLQSEEEDYRDNIPENLQGSERYERADEAVSYMGGGGQPDRGRHLQHRSGHRGVTTWDAVMCVSWANARACTT